MADDSAARAAADYGALYDAHQPRILRLCRVLLHDPDDALEICQEIFLTLHRALRDGRQPERWDAWLTTVALNACRDQRRSRWWRWFRTHEPLDAHDVADQHAGPEQTALDAETRRRVWRALRALPVRQREVFALRQLEGRSTEETAALLGLSTGTVKQHLFRAIRHLRLALQS